MMRSMADSMASSCWGSDGGSSDKFGGFELRNRLVGKPDLVVFAAMEEIDDDLKQPLVDGKRVGDGAAPAQVVRGDGVGIADHLDIHHLQSALDQHGLRSSAMEG